MAKKSRTAKCSNESERKMVLDAALAAIRKQHGDGAVLRMADGAPVARVPVHTTGSIGLDIALGTGGLPAGRVVEIYGPESSGKTTLMLHVVAGVHARGGVAAFIDAEHALDLNYAEQLGVDCGALLVAQPDSGEQALEITDSLVRSAAVDLVVIDSVAALVPRAELEGEMGDQHVGLQARLMSQALRKLTSVAARTGTTVVFINQLRHKIGVMFGSPETTTGGNALKFYSSVRLDIRRVGAVKRGEEICGNRTRVKVVKNKLAPPFRLSEFDILYGAGINGPGELVDLGVECGFIEKNGAWYSLNGERLGQGRESACTYLREQPEVARRLRDEVLAMKLPATDPAAIVDTAADRPEQAAA